MGNNMTCIQHLLLGKLFVRQDALFSQRCTRAVARDEIKLHCSSSYRAIGPIVATVHIALAPLGLWQPVQ